MIDTDKYEGHTPAPWEYNTDDDGWTLAAVRERDDPDRDEFIALITGPDGDPYLTMNADLKLIADVPLLLAEVKRLRSIADDLYTYIVSDADISLSIIEEQMDWREEE